MAAFASVDHSCEKSDEDDENPRKRVKREQRMNHEQRVKSEVHDDDGDNDIPIGLPAFRTGSVLNAVVGVAAASSSSVGFENKSQSFQQEDWKVWKRRYESACELLNAYADADYETGPDHRAARLDKCRACYQDLAECFCTEEAKPCGGCELTIKQCDEMEYTPMPALPVPGRIGNQRTKRADLCEEKRQRIEAQAQNEVKKKKKPAAAAAAAASSTSDSEPEH
jgi:hypothetical protein